MVDLAEWMVNLSEWARQVTLPPGLPVFVLYICTALAVLAFLTYYDVEIFLLSWLNIFQLVPEEKSVPDGMPKLAVRPGGAADSNLKARKVGGSGKKGKEEELDPAASRIGRFSFPPTQLLDMPYFHEFSDSVRCLATAVVVLALCDVQFRFAPSSWTPRVFGGSIAAFTLGGTILQRLITNCIKVQFPLKGTGLEDRILCVSVGVVSVITVFCSLHFLPSAFSAFNFESASVHTAQALASYMNRNPPPDTPIWEPVPIPVTLIHVTLSLLSGALSFILLPSALRLVRCYMIGTDSSLWTGNDLLARPYRIRFVQHLCITLPILTLFLWITPFSELFILQPGGAGAGMDGAGEGGEAEQVFDWASNRGISYKSFHSFRLFLLFFWSVLHLSCLRLHVQSYLNSGAITWYDFLHGSPRGPPATDIIKQRLAMPIHFMTKVASQCLLPGGIPLLLLGLARCRAGVMDETAVSEGYFLPTSLIRESCVFLAWWCSASWAIQTSVILLMFKTGSYTAK